MGSGRSGASCPERSKAFTASLRPARCVQGAAEVVGGRPGIGVEPGCRFEVRNRLLSASETEEPAAEEVAGFHEARGRRARSPPAVRARNRGLPAPTGSGRT